MCYIRSIIRALAGFVVLRLVWFASDSVTSASTTQKVGDCLRAIELDCPDYSYVRYVLFTRLNTNGVPVDLNLNSTGGSLTNFRPSNPTKIIIHGFRSTWNSTAIMSMKDGYLSEGSYNVFLVDWKELAIGPDNCFPIVVDNAKEVGKCVASLVNTLRLLLFAENIHIISLSVGTTVASSTANYLRPYYLLPRITGLDPSWALSASNRNRLEDRLDASDAFFVDAIHTHMLAQGSAEPFGHVDFYVNGGLGQPGCGTNRLDPDFFCNHEKAYEYFAESITSSKGFWGWRCSSIINLLARNCPPTSPAVLMGEHVSHRARGVIKVTTGLKSPYALGPWVIKPTENRNRRPLIQV